MFAGSLSFGGRSNGKSRLNTAVVSGAIHDLSCLAPLSVQRLYEIAGGVSAALARPRSAPSNQPLTDILDSQALLHNAQSALIGALVDHTVARVQLWQDTETLLVTSEGSLEESADGGKPTADKPAD